VPDAVSQKSCNIQNRITQLLLVVNTTLRIAGEEQERAAHTAAAKTITHPAGNDIAENAKRTGKDEQRRHLAGPPVMRLLQILGQEGSG